MTVVPITSPDLDAAEVSWFAALCSDDYQFLVFRMAIFGRLGHIVQIL